MHEVLSERLKSFGLRTPASMVLLLTLILSLGAEVQLALRAIGYGALFSSLKWTAALSMGLLGILAQAAILLLLGGRIGEKLERFVSAVLAWIKRLRGWSILLLVLNIGIFPFAVLGPLGQYAEFGFIRALLFVLTSLLGALFLAPLMPQSSWLALGGMSVLLQGAIFRLALYLPEISTYPLSLHWSETSRYYYASLLMSSRIYGQHLPPSVWHPSRYMLQAVPFFFGELPMWAHRLWQILLWVGMPVLAAAGLVRRLNSKSLVSLSWLVVWAVLYLLQGPVYYHLLISVTLVLWGFDSTRLWKSLIWIGLASIWAGLSRVNWIPVPSVLACMLYILETPLERLTTRLRYWYRPGVWLLAGSGLALISYMGYIALSGNVISKFGSSFVSTLLWYRLLPNATYGPGIIAGTLGLTAPLLILVSLHVLRNPAAWKWMRPLALAAMISVFFLGGLLVSVKIGGGGNLHNMDAYFVLLLVTAGYIHFDRFVPDARERLRPDSMPIWLLALVITLPVLPAIQRGGALEVRDRVAAEAAVARIGERVTKVVEEGGEVLFIAQRHLITFGMIDEVPLVSDYELLELMEMAIAGNREYLARFHEDIQAQRFGLIIDYIHNPTTKGRDWAFGEENDAWVQHISTPLLEMYQQEKLLESEDIVLLTPRR